MASPHTAKADRTQPRWAERRERSITAVARPPLSELDPRALDDLRPLAVLMVARPLLGAVTFVATAAAGWWIAAAGGALVTYAAAVTGIHHFIHGSMGLSNRWRHLWLSILGCLVVESGHALQTTHLAHHRTDPRTPDPESHIEYIPWHRLPFVAARYRYRLALWGLRNTPRSGWVRAEMGWHAFAHLASLALLPLTWLPWLYLTLIHLVSFGFAVFIGKGPQTNFGRAIDTPFVRVVSRVGRVVLFNHDLHLEHHLYPKVPLSRLRPLRRQFDELFESIQTTTVQLR